MKRMQRMALAVALLLGGARMLAASPAECVPAAADAVLFLRLDRIQAEPNLSRLADSGEIRKIALPLIRLGLPQRAVAVAYFGSTERLTLTEVADFDAAAEALLKRYRAGGQFLAEKRSFGRYAGMRLTIYRRKTHAFYASFDAVNFAPPVVAVGDDEEPVPLARLAGPADPRLLAHAEGADVLAAARIVRPDALGFDIMGLCQRLTDVEVRAERERGGYAFRGRAAVSDPAQAEPTRQLLESVKRIALVALFADAPELYTGMDRAIRLNVQGGEIVLQAWIGPELMTAIQQHYDRHAEALKTLVRGTGR